jgi:membrane protein YdbS with pleckstrin-like domain
MRVKVALLGVVIVALVATVWLPFVNTSSLWLGLPSIMVWTAAWVVGITLTLALIEFGRTDEDESDEIDAADGGRS